jgi:uncharacterized protein YgiM (DUF1202 family)
VVESLLIFGAFFALVYLLNGLARALRRNARIVFGDVLLAFLAGLVPLTALIMNNMEIGSIGRVEYFVMATAALLIAGGLVIALLELRRPERLRSSRGVLGGGVGVLLLAMAIATPLLSNQIALPAQVAAIPSPTPGPTQSPANRAFDIFEQVLTVIARQTGLEPETVAVQLDNGTTVADIVREHNGSLETVILGIAQVMNAEIQQMAAEGELDSTQAALGISMMETVVRRGVESDLTGLLTRFAESADQDVLAEIRTAADDDRAAPAETLSPTPAPTLTKSAPAEDETPVTTPTLPALATLMPLPTREAYASPTATITSTLPSPCLIVTVYNVNQRAQPDLDAELLATIPYDTAVTAFGRDSDASWWLVEYEGQAGWVSAEFVQAAAACDALPVREG